METEDCNRHGHGRMDYYVRQGRIKSPTCAKRFLSQEGLQDNVKCCKGESEAGIIQTRQTEILNICILRNLSITNTANQERHDEEENHNYPMASCIGVVKLCIVQQEKERDRRFQLDPDEEGEQISYHTIYYSED